MARDDMPGDIPGFAPPFCLTCAEADREVVARARAVGSVLDNADLSA